MSRLVIPITGKALWATGDVRLWVDIDLLLKDRAGNWLQATFRMDTATDVTTMGAFEAQQRGLPVPRTAASGAVHQQTGLEIRSGVLRFQIIGLDQTEFATPCLFLGDPNAPPAGQQPSSVPRKLLQPLALVDRLRFIFDKDSAIGAPYGEVTIEKK
jgi:hypothetical protein